MSWRRWIPVALPAIVGVLLAILLPLLQSEPPLFQISLSLGNLALLVGLVFSSFAAVGMLLAQRAQQQSENALQKQQEMQSRDRRRFVQRLDHEFKNPLTAIRAGLTNISTATTETERQTAVKTVTNQTMRLVRLTTDLRKIADLETRELETAVVDLTVLLTEVEDLMREQAGNDRQIILTVPRAPWPLPTIIGDWDLLFLAFYNLADNARKFSQTGDTLEIRAREEETAVIVEIADTGRGIAADEVAHVWEDLYRGENGRSVPGSGLGLPLVKAIIERHHGQVSLTSRSRQGTNVTVQLPKSRTS
ncbi:MAG: HAMP domain-containing sensor histidine kinase [Chloroflexota bacterium]